LLAIGPKIKAPGESPNVGLQDDECGQWMEPTTNAVISSGFGQIHLNHPAICQTSYAFASRPRDVDRHRRNTGVQNHCAMTIEIKDVADGRGDIIVARGVAASEAYVDGIGRHFAQDRQKCRTVQ